MQTFPVAAQAPAGPEPGHERIPSFRLDAQRGVVADRAPVAIRKDEQEHDRRYDDAQNEEGNKDDGENHGRHIQESGCARHPALERREKRTAQGSSSCRSIVLHRSTQAVPSSIRSIAISVPLSIGRPSRLRAIARCQTPSC